MSIRCVRVALQSCTRQSRFAAQGTCSFRRHGRASLNLSQSLLTRQPHAAVAVPGRIFSSASGHDNGGEGGDGVVAAAAGNDAGARAVEPSFPWRRAPNLVLEQEGLITKIFLSMFSEEFGTSSDDIKVGVEEAFVCAAAAFFKIRPSEVRAPRPSVAGESDEAPREEGSAGDSAAGAPVVEGEESAEGSEELEAKRALAALEAGLVAFSSGKEEAVRASGAIPYYRLHQVVATAVTSKRVIVGARRGEDIAAHIRRVMSPSWIVLVDMERVGAEIESAVEGNTSIVLQLDVDLACEETFYVTDGETGEVIQGKKRNAGRVHRIRLETNIGTAANPEPPSWKVVDLDNWLQGNSFW